MVDTEIKYYDEDVNSISLKHKISGDNDNVKYI